MCLLRGISYKSRVTGQEWNNDIITMGGGRGIPHRSAGM